MSNGSVVLQHNLSHAYQDKNLAHLELMLRFFLLSQFLQLGQFLIILFFLRSGLFNFLPNVTHAICTDAIRWNGKCGTNNMAWSLCIECM